MTGALVHLKDPSSALPQRYYYLMGSNLFHVDLLVCVVCETVVGSVKDNSVCPVCLLREEMERALEQEKEGPDDWNWGDEYDKF